MKNYPMTIAGKPAMSEQCQAVINPATGKPFAQCPIASPQQVSQAVAAARAAFPAWAATPDAERANTLCTLADIIEENAGELSRLLTQEQGKPIKGKGSEFELGGCVGWTRATAGMQLPPKIIEDNEERAVELSRKPVGVVASITPWNWPLLIAIWHMMPALRLGCTVVVKPASTTPLTTLRLVELLNQALPPGVLNIVCGRAGYALSASPGVDKVVFTGSSDVGAGVMAAAAPSLKRLTLELGGNDAGIVLSDANPQEIAESLFWGAFINAGQTCGALKRLYVHDSIYEAVCEALATLARIAPMGDGMDESNLFGPVQNRAQLDYVAELVEDARQHGATVLCGGEIADGPGYFYPLTIVADISDGVRLVDEEQFGPALPVVRYSTIDEAISRANASPFGLGGSVWSSDTEAAKAIATRLECGTVWINKHGEVKPNIPFGGVKQSGIGTGFGLEGLKEFTTIQVINAAR